MPLSSGPESFGKLNVMAMVRKLIDAGAPILTGDGPPVSGTSGTFSDYPVSQGAIYIDIIAGALYMNHGPENTPAWVLIGTAGGFNIPGKSSFSLMRGSFDASVNDVSIGIHNFLDGAGSPITLFDRTHVLFGWVDTRIALTSGGAAVVGLGTSEEPTDLQTEVTIAGVPWTINEHPIDGPDDWNDPSVYVRIQTDAFLTYSIDGADLTGGKFDVFLYYVQYE